MSTIGYYSCSESSVMSNNVNMLNCAWIFPDQHLRSNVARKVHHISRYFHRILQSEYYLISPLAFKMSYSSHFSLNSLFVFSLTAFSLSPNCHSRQSHYVSWFKWIHMVWIPKLLIRVLTSLLKSRVIEHFHVDV